MKRILNILKVAILATVALGLTAAPDSSDNPGRVVTVDVSVADKDNNPVAGLERENFRLFEDNVEQAITRVSLQRRPLAVVALVEFSESFSYYGADALDPVNEVFRLLLPEDWGALVSFSAKPEILTDFTHDNQKLMTELHGLRMPTYRDAALYDAVYFVLDRTRGLEEKGAVVLLATGFDAMSSRRTFGEALKLAEVSDTPIYAVNFTQSSRFNTFEPFADPGAPFHFDEAEYALGEFTKVSGGMSFTPMFPGQYGRIAESVVADLRHQYTLSFVSKSPGSGNKLRALKVEVRGTDVDHNGKPDKLKIRHKKGYRK